MTIFQQMLAFLVAVGPLIIFHELGHYAVARLCGVKVLRFSVGMGKIVWSRRFGPDQTEWAISALPLGGYVKMLDNRDPATAAKTEEEAEREFTRQSVWKRIAIVSAGPIANFIIAILVYTGLFMHGVEDASTRIRAMPDSAAVYKAGLRAGDRITAVNGTPVATWSELRFEVLHAAIDKTELHFDVAQKGGAHFEAVVPATAMNVKDIDKDLLGALGLAVELPAAQIAAVIPGGPADRAGLRAGDIVSAIDAQPVRDVIDMKQKIVAAGARTVTFAIVRAGQPVALQVTPQIDPVSKVAVINVKQAWNPELVTVPAGPLTALSRAARSTWDNSIMQLKLIGKMVTGEISLKNVTGPITIADFAEKTAREGPIVFLGFIAAISISLGVMNLLPIPVLDGGLLLYYSLEVLTGRPLPERVSDIAQRAGVGLLLMLMALAIFNDVARRML